MVSRIFLFILGAALSCILTREYYVDKHEAFVQKLNAEAEKRENELHGVIDDLLDESYTRIVEIEQLSSDNAKLVRKLGGLRDPGRTYSAKNKSSGSDPKTGAGTVLSDEATEFLLGLTRDADVLREQLRLCQEWAKQIGS